MLLQYHGKLFSFILCRERKIVFLILKCLDAMCRLFVSDIFSHCLASLILTVDLDLLLLDR